MARNNFIRFLIFILFFLNSCTPKYEDEMVYIMERNDINLSCVELEKEIRHLERRKIPRLKRQEAMKIVYNGVVMVFSVLTLFLPLVFVDFAEERKELIETYKKRVKHLKELATINNCYEPS